MWSTAKSLTLAVVVLTFAGCATGPLLKTNHVEGELRGMLYDLDRQPLENATVQVSFTGKIVSGVTDLHGRFGMGTVPFGSVALKITKPNYEPLTWELAFLEGSQVLYLQMASSDQLFERAALALEKKDWQEFEAYLARGRALAPESLQGVVLEATGLELRGRLATAIETLETFVDANQKLSVILLLADLHERAGSIEKATQLWNRALQVRDEPEIREKLQRLDRE